MENLWRRKLGSMAGRPESGHWLLIVTEDPLCNAVEVQDLQEHGGRLNPPRSFPTAYLSEDTEACRSQISHWIRTEADQEKNFVVLAMALQLSKVLDLGDVATRRQLGISLPDLSDPSDMSMSQSLGAAAHREGFAGILYPRPIAKGARNLALFCDHTSLLEVNMAATCRLLP